MDRNTPPVRPARSLHARRRDGSVFVILLACYWVVLFPILRADRYYNDDLKRALFGKASWDSNGRPLATFLVRALQAYDRRMVDLSPLLQLGAVAVLAWAGVLIARRYAIRPPWVAALVAFPLGAQPFYLENLSYKFDALGMSVAILLALVPLLRDTGTRRSWWLGVLALFACLAVYQPAMNAYLVFAYMEIVLAQLADMPPRRLLAMALSRAGQAVVGLGLYEALVGIHISGWVAREATPIHGLWAGVQILDNYRAFYRRFVAASLDVHWWLVYVPVLALLALCPVAVGLRHATGHRAGGGSRAGAIALLVAGLLAPIILSVLALGPMLALAHPEMQPRVLIGVGAMLTASLLVLHAASERWGRSPRWFACAAGALALGMASLASAYGNAAGAQRDYEAHIGAVLGDDLAQLKASRGVDSLLIDGSDGLAPAAAHAAGQIPLVGVLVPPYIAGGASFQTQDFLGFYTQGITDLDADPVAAQARAALLAATCASAAVRVTRAYRLYVVGRTAVVRFEPAAPRCPR
jgi:hypothetical protein